jgi:hypothetical protein
MPVRKKVSEKPRMLITSPKKSAEDKLLESFGQLIDEAAERMTPEEFRKTSKESNEILDRAIAAHSRRRGTA